MGNISGHNSKGEKKTSQNRLTQKKPSQRRAALTRQASTTDNYGNTDNHDIVIRLSDSANKICQMMRKNGTSDHVDHNASDLLEPAGAGLFEIKDLSPNSRGNPAAHLESMSFCKDLIEDYISAGLKGKMKKASANFVAIELGHMINSFANKNGVTIEERAINREAGLHLAEYFANTFLSGPAEVKVFMDGIKGFAQRDTMLEKGYYFWEGQAYEIYKPVPISIFFKRNDARWSKETAEAFKANEHKVTDMISAAITTLGNDIVVSKLEQILAKYHLIINSTNKDTVPSFIQWIKDRQNRQYA